MIILHKGKRIDNNEEVIGFLTKMWGQYHIILENDENTAYPVSEETILSLPCNKKIENDNDIKELINERSLLDSIMKCMLRYCNENNGINEYTNEMRSLIHKYENKIDKDLFDLTGKNYFQLYEEYLVK